MFKLLLGGVRWVQVGKVIMMPMLLLILVPLAVLLVLAVVYDLRRRGLRGAPRWNEISPDRASANAEVQRTRYLPGGGGGGI